MSEQTPDQWEESIVRSGYESPAELMKRAHPRNYRIHTEAQHQVVTTSLKRLGWLKRVIVNLTTGKMIDGHERVEQAHAKGQERVPVDYVELSPEQEREALLLLDPSTYMAETDARMMASLMDEIHPDDEEMTGAAMLAGEALDLDQLLKPTNTTKRGPKREGKKIEHHHEHSQRGAVYVLGPHVLICADSLELDWAPILEEHGIAPEHMVTDPPFAIYGSASGISSQVADDKMVRPFFREVIRLACDVLPLFGTAHVCCDWRSWATWWEVARGTSLTWKNMLIWDKGDGGLGSSYANCHELIGYGVITPETKTMVSGIKRGIRPVHSPNIKRYTRASGADRFHNASKPTALLQDIIDGVGPGDILEPFGGGGSTLIAGAEEGRRVAVCEVEPQWCDVIRRRWTVWADLHDVDPGPGALYTGEDPDLDDPDQDEGDDD